MQLVVFPWSPFQILRRVVELKIKPNLFQPRLHDKSNSSRLVLVPQSNSKIDTHVNHCHNIVYKLRPILQQFMTLKCNKFHFHVDHHHLVLDHLFQKQHKNTPVNLGHQHNEIPYGSLNQTQRWFVLPRHLTHTLPRPFPATQMKPTDLIHRVNSRNNAIRSSPRMSTTFPPWVCRASGFSLESGTSKMHGDGK